MTCNTHAWPEPSACTVPCVCDVPVVGLWSGRCRGDCHLVLQCSSGCDVWGGHWLVVLRWWSCLCVPPCDPRAHAWPESSVCTVPCVCDVPVVGLWSGRCRGDCPLVLQCSSGCDVWVGHWLVVLRWWRRGLSLLSRGTCSPEWDGWSEGPFVCEKLPLCAWGLPVSCCQPEFHWPELC